jgi:hypothetical protein
MALIAIIVVVLGVFLVLRSWRAVGGMVGGVVGALAGGVIATAVDPPNQAEFMPGLGQAIVGGLIGLAIGVAAGIVAVTAIQRSRSRA